MTELKLSPHVAQYTVLLVGRLIASFAILQGVSIVAGGRLRWGADSFAVALMLPGAPPTWGVMLFVCGAVAMIGSVRGRFRPVVYGMFGVSVWSFFFALSFTFAALRSPHASTTGVWAYGAFAILAALIGVAYNKSRGPVN